MKILLLNPPHTAIGSRLAGEHLPPLGLLSIAGPLIDLGYQIKLLDADYSNMEMEKILEEIEKFNPDILLMGHSGSTSAQPTIELISNRVKAIMPTIKIIIGGVFPTYHWKEILTKNKAIDIIVCGEGEEIIAQLIPAMATGNIGWVDGIAYRNHQEIIKTKPAKLIKNLDDYRIAWELMEGYHYTYWGKRRAVVLQFSRGCPYPCSYCGQSLFWKKWRHRNPQKLADEIEMLHHQYGIEVINFADENPATHQKPWIAFLEALIAKNLNLVLVGSVRADNIVRDEAYLHLYKQAGFERFLLGIENYDENVLDKIKKDGSIADDKKAIQLLRKHDILSMATYVTGFGDETWKDFYLNLKHLIQYDPDQIQLLYATPHQWTPYYDEVKDRIIIQPDQRKWDYKHQILKTINLKPWQIIFLVKLTEILLQIRPKAIKRLFFHRDKKLRAAMRWYTQIGRKVWFFEWFQFIFHDKTQADSTVMLKNFWNDF